MKATCENLDQCGYFQRFRDASDASYRIWVTIFCESQEKARDCARKMHMEQTGTMAPDNLTPTGRML